MYGTYPEAGPRCGLLRDLQSNFKENLMAGNIVLEKIKAGARIVDVRTEDEFADGAYPGAINVPVGVLQSKMAGLEPKDIPVVVYCASGARSAMAARMLKAAGWVDVINAGGMDDMPDAEGSARIYA
ncbi:MAG: sulfurtransferase [Treponema sp. GWB1_62_6]|nr:MAG: sulfurtransferase [Treponema sp. GWC1_61_84]OHE65356.1 MAG: sulfurtransferase [Treponema sp. GWB1_62_6]OHE74786.1 MAG: sulfurtransferase [Treponema sp. RIFOXYC1_FULL_61_9]